MKKKYIAFVRGASQNSGIQTKEAAQKWAAKTLADRPNTSMIYIAEITEVAQRTTPTIELKAFEPDLDIAKAA